MSDDGASLSEGVILRIVQGDSAVAKEGGHYIQILKVNPPKNQYGQKKFIVTVHDSKHFVEAALATKFNHLMENNEMIEGSVLELNTFAFNNVKGQNLLIINEMTCLQRDCEILGNPVACPAPKPAASKSGFGKSGGFGGNRSGFGGSATTGGGGGGSGSQFTKVTQLSPFQKDFKIKVRVTRKGAIRTWNNDRGSGKLCSLDLLDMDGGEIQATCFNDVVDKFYETFEEGKVYIISRGRIKVSNKRFTHITNDYQIDLNNDSDVQFVGDDATIQSMRYDFIPLAKLADMDDKAYVDVCGVINAVQDTQTFTSRKTQKELTKRTFRIVDQSDFSVECTLWGDEANGFSGEVGNVCAMKAARVSDFNGKTLSVNKHTLNPEGVPETKQLSLWWQSEGQAKKFTSHSTGGGGGGRDEPPISLAEMDAQGLGNKEQPDFFNVKVCVQRIIHDKEKVPWYKAVPDTDGPAYKVTPSEDGVGWYCERNQKNYATYIPRYNLRMNCSDHTGTFWFNSFDDAGKIIMGQEASSVEKFLEAGDDAGFDKAFETPLYKPWNLRIKARQRTYNDESRRRLEIVGAKPIDLVEDSKEMLAQIKAMTA